MPEILGGNLDNLTNNSFGNVNGMGESTRRVVTAFTWHGNQRRNGCSGSRIIANPNDK
jgi:hypothetical protein